MNANERIYVKHYAGGDCGMKYTYEFRWYSHDEWERPYKAPLFDTWEEANIAGAIYSAKVRCTNRCGINADYRVVEVAA